MRRYRRLRDFETTPEKKMVLFYKLETSHVYEKHLENFISPFEWRNYKIRTRKRMLAEKVSNVFSTIPSFRFYLKFSSGFFSMGEPRHE